MTLKITGWTLLYVFIAGNIFSNCTKTREKRAIIAKTAFKWPDGIIPYSIDVEAFNGEEVTMIQDAINTWNMETCVHFRLRLYGDINWVKITGGTTCHSYVGASLNGEQVVNLASPSCSYYGTYLHELGHVIGLHHEHIHPSRDNYLLIKKEKVKDEFNEFYNKIRYSEMLNFDLPYDMQSIMHYGPQSFTSPDGESTMDTRNDTLEDMLEEIHHKDLSFYDAKVVNLFYECSKKCKSPRFCPSQGYLDQFCQCHTPTSFESRRCYDRMERDWCIEKQTEGECERKATYMSVNCRKTCNRCFKYKPRLKKPSKRCKNIEADSKCNSLTIKGECINNPSYMRINCKKSCRMCQSTSTIESCIDSFPLCRSWSNSNRCYKDYHFMHRNCRKSCKFCGSIITKNESDPMANCKDLKSPLFCEAKAKNGECHKGRKYMQNHCPKTCQFCSKGSLQTSTITYPTSMMPTTAGRTLCMNVLKNNKCELYKKSGDCIRHPEFMFRKCFKTCANCNDFINNNSSKMCQDTEPEYKCKKWQREFKCKMRAMDMAIKCPKTCQFCNLNETFTGCRNIENDKNCDEWSTKGNCSKNAKFMMVQCGKTCGRCHKNNYKDCQDLYGTKYCKILKELGKCSTDPFFMLQKCSKSCFSCDLLGKNISHFICSNVFDDQFCDIWKNDGECQNNPKFMMENCGKSCGICKSHYDHLYGQKICEDKIKSFCFKWKLKSFCLIKPKTMEIVCPKVCDGCRMKENSTEMIKQCNNFYNHKICDKWRNSGECVKNPVFMKSVCKRTCGFCEKSRQENVNCPNLHNDEECKKWAEEKKCKTNSFYMLRMCSKSCQNCTIYMKSIKRKTVCKNEKGNKLCDLWSRTMECTKNPIFMLNDCAKSCGFCNGLKSKHPTLSTCKNKYNDTKCRIWSETDQCKNNPIFMMKNCAKSCGFCNGLKSKHPTLSTCKNKYNDTKCRIWSENDQCKNNPIFMMKNCAKSCGNCQIEPVAQIMLPTTPNSIKNKTVGQVTKLSDCENIYRDDICEQWKSVGSCKHNAIFMLSQCRKSCGKCQKVLQCQNVYNDQTCEHWAKEGKCARNMKFMIMLCMKSCGQCSILNFTIEDSDKKVKDRCLNKYGELSCEYWKEIGECERNSIFMKSQCARSCGTCKGKPIAAPIHSLNKIYKCKNLYNNDICNFWAKSGYCNNSLSFVTIVCSLSCKKCSSLQENQNSSLSCINTKGDKLCDLWTKKGGCHQDSEYMAINCAKSCNSCNGKSIQAPVFQISGNQLHSCSNIAGDIQCSYWARQGQCKINALYMKRFCRKACHHCSTKAEKEMNCTDKYSEFKCQIWAQRGECDRNQVWMIENCSRSCLVCQKPISSHKGKANCKDNLNCFGMGTIEK